MSKKKLTIQDATKEELIQYFFTTDYFGGGYRIPALKDKFLLWLQQKRSEELLTASEASLEESQKALHEYVDCVHKMTEATDVEEKLKWAEQGNAAYIRYEKANKAYNKFSKKVDEVWGID